MPAAFQAHHLNGHASRRPPRVADHAGAVIRVTVTAAALHGREVMPRQSRPVVRRLHRGQDLAAAAVAQQLHHAAGVRVDRVFGAVHHQHRHGLANACAPRVGRGRQAGRDGGATGNQVRRLQRQPVGHLTAVGQAGDEHPGGIRVVAGDQVCHQPAQKAHIIDLQLIGRIGCIAPAVVPVIFDPVRVHRNEARPLGLHVEAVKGTGAHAGAVGEAAMQYQQEGRRCRSRRRYIGKPTAIILAMLYQPTFHNTRQVGRLDLIPAQKPGRGERETHQAQHQHQGEQLEQVFHCGSLRLSTAQFT